MNIFEQKYTLMFHVVISFENICIEKLIPAVNVLVYVFLITCFISNSFVFDLKRYSQEN